MPLTSTKWGGLNRPSSPNAECHPKSTGAALISITTPAITSFTGQIILPAAPDFEAENTRTVPTTAEAAPE